MHKIIISDTSCFIILTNIGELHLLQKLYSKITTTIEIATEFGEPLPEWVEILSAKGKDTQRLLEMQIDKGESSAIALALEISDSLLILDDIKAKIEGIIPSVIPILNKIKQTDFRLSYEVESQVLKAAME